MKSKTCLHGSASAAVLFCIFGLFPSPLFAADNTLQEIARNQEECKRGFTAGAGSIYADDHKKLKTEYDGEHNCEKNSGGELVSHNAAAVTLTPDLQKFRGHFGAEHGDEFLRNQGACRLAYTGAREIFDTFAKMREDYCDKMNLTLQTARNCGSGFPEEKCRKEWEAWRDSHKAYVIAVEEKSPRTLKYFNALVGSVSKAKEGYESDLQKLEPLFSKKTVPAAATTTAAAPAIIESIEGSPEIRPTNGNRQTTTLQEYYNLLKGVDTPLASAVHTRDSHLHQSGLLIQEEEVAVKNVKIFSDAFQRQILTYHDNADRLAKWVTAELDKSAKNGATNAETPMAKLNKYTPGITAAAPLATKLLNPKDDSSAPPPQLTGSSRSPVAEVAAAAGLGALAAHSFDSASRAPNPTAGPTEAPTPSPNAPTKAEVTNFNDHADAKGEKGAGAGALPTATAGKTDNTKPDLESAGSSGGNLGAEGSSRTPAGKKPVAAPSATPAGATVDAGGAGTNEAIGSSFAQNLEPKSAPKPATPSPGSEVANLLGQMKNLFNFDEGAPLGGPPGAPPAVGPPPEGAAYSAASNPGDAPDAPAADVSQSNGEANAETASSTNHGEEIQGSQFGKVDTSLFARVRARHHRCMERGLVLYGLRERVE